MNSLREKEGYDLDEELVERIEAKFMVVLFKVKGQNRPQNNVLAFYS